MNRLRCLRGTGALAVTAMMLLAGCGTSPNAAVSSSTSQKSTSSASSSSSSASAPAIPAVPATGVAYATIPFNAAGFLAPNQKGPTPGFGPNHDLDNENAPKPGKYVVQVSSLDVPFNFPTVAGSTPPNDILSLPYGKSGTITVAPGNYKSLFFLGAVASGPEPTQITLTYKDKTTQTEYVAFDDWCTVEVGHTPVLGTYTAWQGVTRIGEGNGAANNVGSIAHQQGCGLYVSSVPVDSSKVLTSVTISNGLKKVLGPVAYNLHSISTGSRVGIVAVTATTSTIPPVTGTGAPLALPAQQPVSLAPTANSACAKGPTSPLFTAVPAGLLKVNLPLGQFQVASSLGDGLWEMGVKAGRSTLYGMGYYLPQESGYVYLSTDGGIPAGTKNVMLCVEYYDAAKTTSATTGDWLGVQYSGTNTAGPSGGAYDYAPETYAATGTGKWLTASFTLTNINFAQGDPAQGQENNGSDMRVYYNTPTFFDRFWLVTTGVASAQSLSAQNTAGLDAFISKYQ